MLSFFFSFNAMAAQICPLTVLAVGWLLFLPGLLETLRCFHELEEVQLTGLRGVTPEVVSVIAEQNKNLTTLRLDKCPNVDDACLRALGEGCPSLKHVSFSSTQITPCGVRALLEGACRFTLQEFLINGCCNLNSDAVSVLVAGCPSLRILGADSLSGIVRGSSWRGSFPPDSWCTVWPSTPRQDAFLFKGTQEAELEEKWRWWWQEMEVCSEPSFTSPREVKIWAPTCTIHSLLTAEAASLASLVTTNLVPFCTEV